jgi:hypothetical protein
MNASTDQLDSETHARIFEEKIASPRLLQKASYEHPKAIILGGQPGSGKGGLARAANNELADTAVTIDPDNLRRFHPSIKEFRSADPYGWSGLTQRDAGQWAEELLHAAADGKKNVIFDTTLSHGQADYGLAREVAGKQQQQREQQRAQNPRDPRDAGHPDHAMNQSIRQQVAALHEQAGTFISNKELDHLTASVANDARKQRMTRVDQVQFNGGHSALLATQQNGPQDIFSKHSATNIQQAMQTPPEHAYQQMGQETQRQAQLQQNIQQQIAQSQQQGPSLGR